MKFVPYDKFQKVCEELNELKFQSETYNDIISRLTTLVNRRSDQKRILIESLKECSCKLAEVREFMGKGVIGKGLHPSIDSVLSNSSNILKEMEAADQAAKEYTKQT